MESNDRSSRVTVRHGASQPVSSGRTAANKADKKRRVVGWKLVVVVVFLVLTVGACTYLLLGAGSPVDKSKYQAVFLTNGQVYFGKLSGWGGSQLVLTDVYYFQSSADTNEANSKQSETTNSTQTLVKLGEEIHKPSDKLILNRDSVLFVENIEDDGQVVSAIKQNQQSKD